jgi:hypothetical protein
VGPQRIDRVSRDPLLDTARKVIEAVARRLHPETQTPWAEFSLPDLLLLTKRVSQDLRREALRTIPGIRKMRFSHALWLRQMAERYGPMFTVGYKLWRVVRAVWNPTAAVGREISLVLEDNFATVLVDQLRARFTQQFVLEVGCAAIDLYSGRLVLSEDELRLLARIRRFGRLQWTALYRRAVGRPRFLQPKPLSAQAGSGRNWRPMRSG